MKQWNKHNNLLKRRTDNKTDIQTNRKETGSQPDWQKERKRNAKGANKNY